MTTVVDTNALLALLYDEEYAGASETALRNAYQKGRVVVPPTVYAELAADGHFERSPELDQFLADLSIQVVEPTQAALFRAGEQFQQYTRRRPDGLQCPACGTKRTVCCEDCGERLTPRQHIAADFVIGGHATADGNALISFDSAFYETHFPSLSVYPE